MSCEKKGCVISVLSNHATEKHEEQGTRSQYLQKQTQESFLTLEERIRRNPAQREKLLCEARAMGIQPIQQKQSRQSPVIQPSIQIEATNEPKDWIMNLTQSEIIFDFTSKVELSKDKMRDRSQMRAAFMGSLKTLKHYMPKYDFTEEELNSNIFKQYYSKGLIKDVTATEAKTGLEKIRKQQEQEDKILEQKRAQVEIDKQSNQFKQSDVRSLGGVSLREVDLTSEQSGPTVARTGDGGVIRFAEDNTRQSASSEFTISMDEKPSREEQEMENLINSAGKDPQEMGGLFSIPEYEA